jgi:D-beta-D-heptose 7-phosphate kinase/D-beta-D-heptose 1-phosphate adenosyltransferase
MGYVLDKNTVTVVIKQLKKSGDRIVLTPGAFDLFHVGQLEFLRKTKQKGELLIVALESDKRIASYKSLDRPIIPLEQRLKIVSHMQTVDFCFPIFGTEITNEYYLKLYDELKPNIVTYGRSYAGENTIHKAADYFTDITFKKITHKYDRIQSTSRIIDKIRK